MFTDFLQNRCSDKLCKFHKKTPLLKSFFGKILGLKAWNFIKMRLNHKYFPVKFAQFKKKHICKRLRFCSNQGFTHWLQLFHFSQLLLLLVIMEFVQKGYKNDFFILFFTIIYPKISMNVAKTISPWQKFANTH